MNTALLAVQRLLAVASPAAGEMKVAYGEFNPSSDRSEHA
jgi:hypothetical protein